MDGLIGETLNLANTNQEIAMVIIIIMATHLRLTVPIISETVSSSTIAESMMTAMVMSNDQEHFLHQTHPQMVFLPRSRCFRQCNPTKGKPTIPVKNYVNP
jgi:hypothetical protein